jgi:membrane-bound lytic murein transglycosylase A
MTPCTSSTATALWAAALSAVLAGCAWSPARNPEPPPDAPPPVAERLGDPSPNASIVGQARTFSTQHATYTSVGFETVPGWMRDDFSQSWPAFLESCKVLANRGPQWQEVCTRAVKVDAKSNAAIRNFFEREFSAYQIRDDDRRPDGVVTGYFESEIKGNRAYSPPYIYPVYGTPEDMLFLDARKLPKGSGAVAARVQGRDVIVQTGLSTRDMGAPGLYALDLSAITRDALDRKVRLRIDGKRLLPYYTREEIETLGAPNAPVLAFVSSPTELYEMQIQGSGRIRLANGQLIRLGYAEQNGQPFRPTLATAKGKTTTAVRTRGGALELELDDGDDEDDAIGANTIRVRGFTLARPAKSGLVAVPGRRVAGVTGSGIQDPSYVFFKEVAATGGGPVGALGVPLSAGRSIAVDPRSTPLGYPVFVSTRLPDSKTPVQRLTVAQDTGGAIRGAVRADYFFGNGTQAATQARRMKERGQMWLLLPRGLQVAAASSTTVRTRGGAVGDDLPDCLVPDGEECVNE